LGLSARKNRENRPGEGEGEGEGEGDAKMMYVVFERDV
jgi:hypothetical protein